MSTEERHYLIISILRQFVGCYKWVLLFSEFELIFDKFSFRDGFFWEYKGRVQLKVQLDWNFWSCLESLLHGQPWIFNIVNKLSDFISSPQKSHRNHVQLWKLWACHISLDGYCYEIGIWYSSLYNTLQ